MYRRLVLRSNILNKNPPNFGAGSASHREGKGGKAGIILLVAVLAIVGFFLWRELHSPPPTIQLSSERKGIGRSTPISFTVSDRRGLRNVTVVLDQGGSTIPVWSQVYGSRWAFWRSGPRQVTQEVVLGAARQAQLKDGPATLRIVAQNKNWASSQATLERTLAVRSHPPTITVHSGLLYINQAGCEMVLYQVSPGAVSSGVRVGTYFFPGFPL